MAEPVAFVIVCAAFLFHEARVLLVSAESVLQSQPGSAVELLDGTRLNAGDSIQHRYLPLAGGEIRVARVEQEIIRRGGRLLAEFRDLRVTSAVDGLDYFIPLFLAEVKIEPGAIQKGRVEVAIDATVLVSLKVQKGLQSDDRAAELEVVQGGQTFTVGIDPGGAGRFLAAPGHYVVMPKDGTAPASSFDILPSERGFKEITIQR